MNHTGFSEDFIVPYISDERSYDFLSFRKRGKLSNFVDEINILKKGDLNI